MEETLEAAVVRELEEETGLHGISLQQVHAFGDPGRDPRGRSVSIVYFGTVSEAGALHAADDAAEAAWFPLECLPPLAFDHGEIIAHTLARFYRTDQHD